MNKFKLLGILFLSILLVACSKSDDESSGVGDVLIVAKKSGTKTVYGVAVYAYTFSAFKSVLVVGNSGDESKTYSLKANQGFKTNFYYELPDSEYSSTVPSAATYNFSAVFENGNTDEFQDELTDKYLPLPEITSKEYNTLSAMFEIEWALLDNADSYLLQVWDGSNQVFGSLELGSEIKAYHLSAYGSGWATGFTPGSGKTYTVKLCAYLYENGINAYNLQASSVTEFPITWIE